MRLFVVCVYRKKDITMSVYYFAMIILSVMGYIFNARGRQAKNTAVYLVMAFCALVFIVSFRYGIGFDYFSYERIYEMVSAWSFRDILRYYWYEPFYFLICKIFSLAGCSYPVFLLGINIFLIAAAMWFIYRYSKLPWVSVYLYIALQFLAYNMNLVRQSIAVVFFLFAYPSLKNRKIVLYTVWIFIGGLFHNSLWFVWPLFFFLRIKNTKKHFVGFGVIGALVYLFFVTLFAFLSPFLPLKYVHYQAGYFWIPSTFGYLVPYALYCLIVYLFRERIADPKQRCMYLDSALYSAAISLFITRHFILERFAVYPFALSLIALPEIIVSYENDRKWSGRSVPGYYRVLILILVFGGVYFSFSAAKGVHSVYPYVSLMQKGYSAPDEMFDGG